jgi:N-acetylmuramoyl-L-alanine amidase
LKKDIQYILGIILFTFYAYAITSILSLKKDNTQAIYTNSTAITSHVIVIDAGHGKPDEGAVGIYGSNEETLNLKIALKLQALVEQSGGIVYLTRSDENEIYSEGSYTIRQKKVSDIKNRVSIGNQEDVDIFVSIHLNKYLSSSYSGWQTFYQEDNEESIKLANCVQEGLNNSISTPNNRKPMPLKGIYIMDNVDNPTITVECGFLSNEEEAIKLEDNEYQEKLAWGIYMGIQEYFN